LLATLAEMQKSSEPGPHDEHCQHTPDYFDSADKIAAQVKLLTENQQKLNKIDNDFANHEDMVDNFISKSREVDDNSGLDLIITEFNTEKATILKI
jgi:predicted transglutaminase-like cysteine proteinase